MVRSDTFYNYYPFYSFRAGDESQKKIFSLIRQRARLDVRYNFSWWVFLAAMKQEQDSALANEVEYSLLRFVASAKRF